MYLSLDRLDLELEPANGRPRVIQTDHRAAEEIAQQPAASTIIALIRCLNPRRMYPDVQLYYHCAHIPPDFLGQAIAACGAHLAIGDVAAIVKESLPPAEVDDVAIDRLANAALQRMASHAPDPLDALQQLEHALTHKGFPEESDTVAFWSAVLELGALAGAAIGANNAGRWFYDVAASGSFPFNLRCSYRRETAKVNPLGKALKFVRGKGDGEDPSALVKMLASSP